MNFAEALTRELMTWQDETQWLSVDVVADMLTRAAAAVIDEVKSDVRVYRLIDPAGLDVFVRLEFADSPEDTLLFLAADVAVLRALLATLDETQPAQVGEILTIPTRLEDGRVVGRVVPEMLE